METSLTITSIPPFLATPIYAKQNENIAGQRIKYMYWLCMELYLAVKSTKIYADDGHDTAVRLAMNENKKSREGVAER